ncbi:MAG: LPS export ABC transporter permease LptG [Gammaproteobacteria bacterium]
MRLLNRYIGGVVVTGTLIALLVLVGLDIFFSVIEEIDNVGRGSYSLSIMLQSVLLTTPQSLYELFPLATLLGSLMGLGAMANHSELMAMRACGLSVWRIVRSVLQTGLLILIVAVFIGEVIAPVAELYGQNLRASATERGVSFLGRRGLWVRDDNLYINAGKVLARERLADLTVYEFDDAHELRVATRAAQAEFRDEQWFLSDVQQSIFDGQGITVSHAESVVWPSLLTPDLLGIVQVKPKNMSVVDIGQLVNYLDENGLDTAEYRYAFWGRFMTPLSALVMLFISVPFVFGSLRSVGAGQRIFFGMLIGFSFYIFTQLTAQMGLVYGLHPLLAMLLPVSLFMIYGVRAMQRL